jgi:DNA polymerase elongation subunit (family B)
MTYISASMSKDRNTVNVWERTEDGKRITRSYKAPYYFYVEDDDGPFKNINGVSLRKRTFDTSYAFYEAKDEHLSDGDKLYESDINPVYKVLSEKYYNKPVGKLNFTFFDIEVDYKSFKVEGNVIVKVRDKHLKEAEITVEQLRKISNLQKYEVWDEIENAWIPAIYSRFKYDGEVGFPTPEGCYAAVSAISIYHAHTDEMVLLVLLPENGKWTEDDIPDDCHALARVVVCQDEIELLSRFYDEIDNSDIISGWNSSGFDIPYMYFRTKKVMGEGWANKLCFDGAPPPRTKEVEIFIGSKQMQVDIYGRCHIDYLELFKKLETTTRPSFTLDAISEEVLPEEKKLEYDCSLYELYYNYFPDFCRYNIRDTVVLKGFERKLGYMGVAIATYHSETVLINDVLGTVRLVESAIINTCHYEEGTTVPDSKQVGLTTEKFAGALVIYPKVGMHESVASIDFKSLYPSIFRTLNISPEKLVGQFHSDHKAYEEISAKSDKSLTLIHENTNRSETHTALEWSKILKDRQCSLSGYGTVFDQKEQGFMPKILEKWYNERVGYRQKATEAKDKIKLITSKYGKDETYSEEDEKAIFDLNVEYDYYHKLQFIKKILLNSFYGCCGNKYFKFYDIRMAESTTRSGREALLHMCRTIANILTKTNDYQWSSAQELPKKWTFPCDYVIYSDTDSCYFSVRHWDIVTGEDIFNMSKVIEGKVNVAMKKFTEDFFYCVGDFRNNLIGELDVISDRAIFIKKKYYVMHLLYEEGKPKEKMKVMGVQIKKTTIPKPISKKLTKYIEDLLKGRVWLDIAREVVAYKDQLLTEAKIVEIGLPKGIKGIEKYTADYNANVPGLRIPGHVAAAMFYNKCLEVYKDHASPKIVSGMKIKTYYLKKKFGYFKSIALPTDLQLIPDWFRDNFLNLVDKKAQVDRLVDKPLDSILNAIDKVSPTRKTILIEELFEF